LVTYELYQIFRGTFASIARTDANGDPVTDANGQPVYDDTLGNLAYGNGLKLTDEKYDGKTAEELAATITNTAEGARKFANDINADLQNGVSSGEIPAPEEGQSVAPYTWNNLSEGYYIIKDVTTAANMPEGETADLVVVQVLDNVEITAKSGTVEFDKNVADRNDSTQAPTVYDKWGKVSDYDVGDDVPYQVTIKLPANFSSYKTYQMTMHDDMDSGLVFNDDVKVWFGDQVVPKEKYTVTKNSNGHTFEIVFAEVVGMLGAADNAEYTITYSAKLNGSNIVYGNPGNKNEAWLTYSNNPTTGGEGGTTPHKTTVTFTYKFEVDKVDKDKKPLAGAEFKLEKYIKAEEGGTDSWKTLALQSGGEGTVFTFAGLDDGYYRITETKTPAGYNSINPIYFRVTATEDAETLSLPANSVIVKQTDENWQDITTNVTAEFNVTLTKVDDGKDAGLIDTEVVNQSGTVLPSTGGIGTTIFYVVGGVLVLAAIILLVTKKRMSE